MQRLERRSDRWISAGLSVLLHGALIGALIYGWWTFRHQPKPPPTLAIDATVVSSKSLQGGPAGVEHKPPQPPPPLQTVTPTVQAAQPQTVTPPPQTTPLPSLSDQQTVPTPPTPKPDHTAEQKAQQEAEQKAEAEAQQKAADRKAEQEAEQRAAAQAVAERKAKEAEAKKRAEQQRLAEAKRKAEAERKAAEQRQAAALAQNQAELAQGVDADEKLLAERTGPAMASWAQLITARIQRAWIRPPTARPGIDCFIDITQVPGGQVVNVKLGACNGDEAVRQSIQDAAFRASPLPPPSDPALFEREIRVEFKPTE